MAFCVKKSAKQFYMKGLGVVFMMRFGLCVAADDTGLLNEFAASQCGLHRPTGLNLDLLFGALVNPPLHCGPIDAAFKHVAHHPLSCKARRSHISAISALRRALASPSRLPFAAWLASYSRKRSAAAFKPARSLSRSPCSSSKGWEGRGASGDVDH